MGQEPEGPEAVVGRYEYDTLGGQQFTGIGGAVAGRETAAMDPDHHRQPRADVLRPRPHVERQAVLVHLDVGASIERAALALRLHARRAGGRGVPYVGPRLHRAGGRPAAVADGGGRIRNAVKLLQAVFAEGAADGPSRDGDLRPDSDRCRRDRRLGGSTAGRQRQQRQRGECACPHESILVPNCGHATGSGGRLARFSCRQPLVVADAAPWSRAKSQERSQDVEREQERKNRRGLLALICRRAATRALAQRASQSARCTRSGSTSTRGVSSRTSVCLFPAP